MFKKIEILLFLALTITGCLNESPIPKNNFVSEDLSIEQLAAKILIDIDTINSQIEQISQNQSITHEQFTNEITQMLNNPNIDASSMDSLMKVAKSKKEKLLAIDREKIDSLFSEKERITKILTDMATEVLKNKEN